jgi:two-component system sensor kinase FixL
MDRRGEVRIRSRVLASDLIEIFIADSGPGILPEHHDKVLHMPFTTRPDGSGYGLLLSQYFIERMGGTLRLMPHRPQSGAEFVVRLPLARSK